MFLPQQVLVMQFRLPRDKLVRDAVPDAAMKVICETCDLSPDDQEQAYRAAYNVGADFLKTSTGFGEYGARTEDVERMTASIDDMDTDLGVTASGGVGTADEALELLEASGMDSAPDQFRVGVSRGPADFVADWVLPTGFICPCSV